MKGRCYHKLPCDYFIQYTGNNADEVIDFLHEIDSNIDNNCLEIKEIELDGERLLNFVYDDGFLKEEFSASSGSFIVIDDKSCGDEINEYSEYEFHHCFHIANEEGCKNIVKKYLAIDKDGVGRVYDKMPTRGDTMWRGGDDYTDRLNEIGGGAIRRITGDNTYGWEDSPIEVIIRKK